MHGCPRKQTIHNDAFHKVEILFLLDFCVFDYPFAIDCTTICYELTVKSYVVVHHTLQLLSFLLCKWCHFIKFAAIFHLKYHCEGLFDFTDRMILLVELLHQNHSKAFAVVNIATIL
jgi:hypothetical protein